VTSASLNLRRQLAEDPELHHEDELVVLDAMRRNPEDMGQARFNLSRCVSASNADPSHRIRAAIVSIALADNNGESVEVQKAYEAVAPIIQSPLVDHFSRALLQVIYHTTTGDIGIAVAAANELLRGDWRKQRPDSIAKSLRYAAHAYRVAGMPESACEASAEALRIAERYTLEGAALTACIQLANIAMDLENTDYAKHWYEHASLWSARSLDSQDRWDFATAGGRLSILLRQPEEALARLAMGPEQILGDSILRSRVLKAGIFLRASKELGVSGLCRTTLGRDFLTRFPAFSRTIFQDFNAVTYFSLRSEEVGLKGATSDLQAYVHEWRRETAPLSPELTRLICQVGITPRPPTRPDHH
jgi:tetratricopeptide (TPR) repeat protein